MTTSDELIAVLEKEPDNFPLYGITADLLEEEGEGELAIVFRYCHRNKKRPTNGFEGSQWFFYIGMEIDNSFPQHWVLSVDKQGYYRKTLRERLASLLPFIGEMQ